MVYQCDFLCPFLLSSVLPILWFWLFNRVVINYNRRPTALHDRNRDSDDDDYQDRDYDVAALANNLSQAFRYGIYSNDELDEVPLEIFCFALCLFL